MTQLPPQHPAPHKQRRPEQHERPPLPWDRLILNEEQAAQLLKMPRPRFRALAASGEFARVPYGLRSFRYYAYDLLDWALAKRN